MNREGGVGLAPESTSGWTPFEVGDGSGIVESVPEGIAVAEEAPVEKEALTVSASGETPNEWAHRMFDKISSQVAEGAISTSGDEEKGGQTETKEENAEGGESGFNREMTPERLRSLLFLGVGARDILRNLDGLKLLVPEEDIIGVFLQKNEKIEPEYRYGSDKYLPVFFRAHFNMSAMITSGQLSSYKIIGFLDNFLESGVSAELILDQFSPMDIVEYANTLREKGVDVSPEVVRAAAEKYLVEGNEKSDERRPSYSGVEYSAQITVDGDDCEYLSYDEEKRHEKEQEETLIERIKGLVSEGETLVAEGVNFEELLKKAPSNYWRLLDKKQADELLSCGVGIEFIAEKIVGVHRYGQTRWRREAYYNYLSSDERIDLQYLQEKGLDSPATWIMKRVMEGSPVGALGFVPLEQRVEFLKNNAVVEAEEE